MSSSIATRTGDHARRGWFLASGCRKIIHASSVGRLDEFNAALGLAKATAAGTGERGDALARDLENLQRDLVPLMGELAADDADQGRYLASRFGTSSPRHWRGWMLRWRVWRRGDPPLSFEGWATPGKTLLAATLDLARVAARRAERQLVGCRKPVRPCADCFCNT